MIRMDDYCAFSRDHKCIKFMDYQLTRLELEESDTLCHGNWIEIQCLRHYIDQLKEALIRAGVDIPEYDCYDPDDPYQAEAADDD